MNLLTVSEVYLINVVYSEFYYLVKIAGIKLIAAIAIFTSNKHIL